jgi:hypothetical protein
VPKRYYELQRVHFQDNGLRNNLSGVQMTMFGGTSPLGSMIGSMMTKMGTLAIYPYRHMTSVHNKHYRELKITADVGYKAYVKLTDFTDEK